jgi:type IV pilus assembly protein PilM
MSTPRSSAPASHWLASPPPSAAVEITPEAVTALTMARDGGRAVVSSVATAALGDGVVTPGLNAVNLHDPAALTAAIRTAVEALSPRPRRVALILPGTVGKVSILRFEQVPARAADLEQLIRWQVRKAAPYRLEDAQVAWMPGAAIGGGGREFVVTTARRDVIASYEQACNDAGLHAGVVDLASFNLINAAIAAAPEPPTGDWLVVHVASGYATLAVMRGLDLMFFRNRAGAASAEIADLVHQTAMYHQDRLGGGAFSRVVMAAGGPQGAAAAIGLREAVQQWLQAPVTALALGDAVGFRDRIESGPELVSRVGPAIGALLRDRVA